VYLHHCHCGTRFAYAYSAWMTSSPSCYTIGCILHRTYDEHSRDIKYAIRVKPRPLFGILQVQCLIQRFSTPAEISSGFCISLHQETETNKYKFLTPPWSFPSFHNHTHKRTTSISKGAYYKNVVIILSDNYQFPLPVGSSNPRIPLTRPSTIAAVSDKRWLLD
jgi:hypothetical protein